MKRAKPVTKRRKAKAIRKPVAPSAKARSRVTAKKRVAKKTPSATKSIAPKKKSAAIKLTPSPKKSPKKIAPRRIAKAKSVSLPTRLKTAKSLRHKTKRATKKPTSARSAKRIAAAKPRIELPAYLIESDENDLLTEAGAAEKFSLGPSAPPDHFDEGNAPLPSSYGTGKMFLTARDPHWLYAHWDFSSAEQFRHNSLSVDRHLIVRLYAATEPEKHLTEIHVHPESRHWFVHVEKAGQNYFTELGYYKTGQRWKSLATSTTQRTPPDDISKDSTVTFATVPMELSFETMLALLRDTKDSDEQNIPLARAIESIRTLAREHFQTSEDISEWSPEQAEQLEQIITRGRKTCRLPNSEDASDFGGSGEGPSESHDEWTTSIVTSFSGDEDVFSPGSRFTATNDV